MPRPLQKGVWTEVEEGKYPTVHLYLDEKKIASWSATTVHAFLDEMKKDADKALKIHENRIAARDDDRY